jgi:hypothetical protein
MNITIYEEIPKLVTGLYYLAAPYGDSDPAIIEQRMVEYEKVDAFLAFLGVNTMSPLDKHYKLKYNSLPGTYKYWQDYCDQMLFIAQGLIVITLPGWDASKGVAAEIQLAKELGLPIYYVRPLQ